jgi:hypothetical protein
MGASGIDPVAVLKQLFLDLDVAHSKALHIL